MSVSLLDGTGFAVWPRVGVRTTVVGVRLVRLVSDARIWVVLGCLVCLCCRSDALSTIVSAPSTTGTTTQASKSGPAAGKAYRPRRVSALHTRHRYVHWRAAANEGLFVPSPPYKAHSRFVFQCDIDVPLLSSLPQNVNIAPSFSAHLLICDDELQCTSAAVAEENEWLMGPTRFEGNAIYISGGCTTTDH
ncbi:hypothetical protein HMN09_00777300 [Mycena chlorophos]|uniref:Uncharacterized protein n=1 Tax=Mycena chlorophos TaxID=658473 RepID=A0A8H6W4D0_MYCCL|nr:hypothetical protein HMN09_00777300 [Mycena chlorophos]